MDIDQWFMDFTKIAEERRTSYERSPVREALNFSPASLASEYSDYSSPGDWTALGTAAAADLNKLAASQAVLAQVSEAEKKARDLAGGYKKFLKPSSFPLKDSTDWATAEMYLRQGLESAGSADEDEVDDLVAFIGQSRLTEITRGISNITGDITSTIENARRLHLVGVAGALIGSTVAAINLSETTSWDMGQADSFVASHREQLDQALSALWRAVDTSSSPQSVCADLLLAATQALAAMDIPMQYCARWIDDINELTYWSSAINIGDEYRQSLTLYLYCRMLAEKVAQTNKFPRSLQTAAHRTGVIRREPAKVTPIADLKGHAEGELLTIEGTAGPLTFDHDFRGSLMKSVITDAAGASINVYLTYHKLNAGGLREGSPVRVSGTYRIGSRWANGENAIQVARRNAFRDSSGDSWGYIRYQIRKIFEELPDNVLVHPSPARSSSGLAMILNYSSWVDSRYMV